MPVQWVGRDHHVCFSLQKEKHWVSLWFSLKTNGENLGKESIRGKKKREKNGEGERWRNIILKSTCKSLAVQLPLALKGFALLKPHASSWQLSHKDVKSEGVFCYGLGFLKFIYLENRFLNFYNKRWKHKQQHDSIRPTQPRPGLLEGFFHLATTCVSHLLSDHELFAMFGLHL